MACWQRLLVLPLLALVGCAVFEDSSAYVAGNFTLRRAKYVTAFVLTDQQSGREYLLPFTARTHFHDGHNETRLLRLPPGTYRVTHWVVFDGPAAGEPAFRSEMKPSQLTRPFTLRERQLLFLGSFVADNQKSGGDFSSTTSGTWTVDRVSP
jgi:hypothetical protein